MKLERIMGLFGFFQKKKDPSGKPVFVEKRLLPRWKIAAFAKIKLPSCVDYIPCEVKDLNLRGFCLVTSEKITDYNGHAQLYFDEKYSFNIEICVTWHKEAGEKQVYGIRFLRVRDSDREKIYQMMKEIYPNCLGKFL